MDFLKTVWDKFDGYKTYIGLLGYVILRWLGPGVPPPDLLSADQVSNLLPIFELIGGVGLIAKGDKLIAAFKK